MQKRDARWMLTDDCDDDAPHLGYPASFPDPAY